jgi:hypothetical protein
MKIYNVYFLFNKGKSIQSNVIYELKEHTKNYRSSIQKKRQNSQIYKHLLEYYKSGNQTGPNFIF